MSKIIKFRKDADTPFKTKDILSQLLTANGKDGGTIKEMVRKVDLMERIEKGPEEGEMEFSDSEYDMLKTLYEDNKFPMNTRFFITVYEDITNYTRPVKEKLEPQVADEKPAVSKKP